MSDFKMDKDRPINNNSGAMKSEDIITNVDRRPGHPAKVIAIDDGEAKGKKTPPDHITKVKE